MKLLRFATAVFIGLNSVICFATDTSSQEMLSANVADSLIQQEMGERKAAEQLELEHIRSFTSQKKIVTSNGSRKITLTRISKPSLPQRNVAARAVASIEQSVDSLSESKVYQLLSLSATVYDDQVTELVMLHEGKKLHVFVNINFHYLQGVGLIETTDTVYSVIMIVLPGSRQQEDDPIPMLSDFAPGEVEFLFADDSDPELGEEAFRGVDELCRYYLENELQLQVTYQRNEALSAARARYLENNPPKPVETIFNFWKK